MCVPPPTNQPNTHTHNTLIVHLLNWYEKLVGQNVSLFPFSSSADTQFELKKWVSFKNTSYRSETFDILTVSEIYFFSIKKYLKSNLWFSQKKNLFYKVITQHSKVMFSIFKKNFKKKQIFRSKQLWTCVLYQWWEKRKLGSIIWTKFRLCIFSQKLIVLVLRWISYFSDVFFWAQTNWFQLERFSKKKDRT